MDGFSATYPGPSTVQKFLLLKFSVLKCCLFTVDLEFINYSPRQVNEGAQAVRDQIIPAK